MIDLREGPSSPVFRNLKSEKIGDDGRSIVLHYREGELVVFLDSFTADDERRLQLQECEAAVTLVLSAVVGRHDDDGILVDPGILERLNYAANLCVQGFLAGHVVFAVPSVRVSGFIQGAEMS